jgi:hypothetical protein
MHLGRAPESGIEGRTRSLTLLIQGRRELPLLIQGRRELSLLIQGKRELRRTEGTEGTRMRGREEEQREETKDARKQGREAARAKGRTTNQAGTGLKDRKIRA